MTASASHCMVLTTTPTMEQAEQLARKVVSAKLGACVQVLQVKSFYMWKEQECAEPECLLLVKARTSQYAELEAFIKANHTYETPEIIQLPITAGFAGYLNWIDEATAG